VRFEVDGLTTATTRVITVPDADITIARAGANNDITSLTACTALTNAAGIDIKGTNTSDSAAAGDVGEYVSSAVGPGSPVSLTSTVAANVTSISLTAGDWDVEGNVGILSTNASTSITVETGGVGTTSATFGADFTQQRHAAIVHGNGVGIMFPVPKVRVSLSGTGTVYLVANATFTVSTCTAYGTLRARRVR
jgi:hypothetical protein